MVQITDYKKLLNSKDEEFIMLVLQGEPELLTSKTTGRNYFTARKVSIPCTFDEHTAKRMIGTRMPGSIVKQPCEPYFYNPPNSNEEIELDYTYAYDPSISGIEEIVTNDMVIS